MATADLDGFMYDADAGHIAVALRFGNSVLPDIVARREFWLFLAAHVVCAVLYTTDMRGFNPEGKSVKDMWNSTKAVTAITVFFQVFYTNSSYTRYIKVYQIVRKMLDDIVMAVFDLRLFASPKSHAYARLATRFLFASVLMFFSQMDDENSVTPLGSLRKTLEPKLLTEKERTVLNSFPSAERYRIVLHWCYDVFITAGVRFKIPVNVKKVVLDRLHRVHQLMLELEDTIALPVPFQYFHLMNALLVVNLSLWAYTMAASESFYGVAIFFVVELIFMGMMRVGSELSNPFGSDAVDFPMAAWLFDVFDRAETLLEYDVSGVSGDPSRANSWKTTLTKQGRLRLSEHGGDQPRMQVDSTSGDIADAPVPSYQA